jgi:hypothetical protein
MNKTIQVNVYLNEERLKKWEGHSEYLKSKTKECLIKEIDAIGTESVVPEQTQTE